MTANKPTKKQKILKFLAISSVILSLVLSSMAMYYSSDLEDLESGDDGNTSLHKTGPLYGTHGCENGGFSIQTGVDENRNGFLEGEEVSEIKNVCHGTEGPPGPMGNRGYWGYNGTNGTNGSDGVIGVSSFIESYVGQYGPCSEAAVIEMGNNSSSREVESMIKICFDDLASSRLTDINPNSVNSFSTACEGGIAHQETFIFAATRDGFCLLYKIENGIVSQISDNLDFAPGSILGFTIHNGRIWFDANDGSGVDLWSSDGDSLWKETNLSLDIQQGDKILKNQETLVLQYSSGLMFFNDSETYVPGTYSNLTSANQILIYNTNQGISLGGSLLNGEINSDATFHDGYYWFIATSDSDGAQLHRANSQVVEKMTTNLVANAGQKISPTILGSNLVFDSGGLFAYNTSSLTLDELNSSIQNIGTGSDWLIFEDKIWFQCGVPGLGWELCASNGIDAWLHSDYAANMESSEPQHLAIVDDKLIALVNHPIDGGQLVIVTENGIDILWDHHVGDYEAGGHGELWVGNEMIFFIGDDPTFGLEMYGWAHGGLSEEWIIIH